MRTVVAIALTAALAGTGCLRGTEYRCASNEQCSGGTCQPVGYCSFADQGCDSGQRFGDSAGSYAGTCVGDGVPDAGVDTPLSDAPNDTSGGGCPDAYAEVAGGQGNHRYRIVVQASDWDDQRDECEDDGANVYLAVPDSAGELTALSSLFMQTGTYWVGITDEATEGTWLDVNGAPVTFLPWGAGQPNNGGGNSHCVAVDRQEGTYNDQRCQMPYRAVCECEP